MMHRCIAAVALGAGLLSGCAYNSPPPTVVYGYAPCAAPATAAETPLPPTALRPPVQPPPGASPPPLESGTSDQCVVPLPTQAYPVSPYLTY
jgi:hypothetical protein